MIGKTIYRCAIAAISAVLVLVFIEMPHRGFYSGDSGVLYIQSVGVEKSGFKSLDVIHNGERFLGGQYQDDDGFLLRRGSALTAQYPPAFSAVSAIFHSMFGRRGLFALPFLSLFGSACLISFFFRGSKHSLLLGYFAVLGAPVLFYGYSFSAHAPAVFLVLSSVYFAVGRDDPGGGANFFVSGLIVAAAVWFRTEIYCAAPAILVAIIYEHRKKGVARITALYVSGALAGLVPLWIFNKFVYGNPLGLHIAANLSAHQNWLAARKYIAPIIFSGASRPLFVAAFFCAAALAFIGKYPVKNRLGGASLTVLFAAPILFFLFREMASLFYAQKGFDPSGLFWTFPVSAIAPLAFLPRKTAPDDRRDNRYALLIVATCYALTVFLTTPNEGGAQWGPRFLSPMAPLISAAVFMGILSSGGSVFRKNVLSIVLVAGIAAGVAVQTNGIRAMRGREKYIGSLVELAEKTVPNDAVVLTDLWWAEQVIPDTFLRTRMFYVASESSARRLLSKLAEKNVKDVWLVIAPETRGAVIEKALIGLGLQNKIQTISQTPHSYHNLVIVRLKATNGRQWAEDRRLKNKE